MPVKVGGAIWLQVRGQLTGEMQYESTKESGSVNDVCHIVAKA